MLNRAKAGIGVATIGMAMALIPAISPASASVSSVSGVSGVSSLSSLSSSALCRDYKNQQSALANTQSSALARAYASGNWPAIQKALLSTYSSETGTVSKLESVLSGAPSNVKAAVGTFLQFENTHQRRDPAVDQPDEFRHTGRAVSTNPKLASAGKVLTAYGAKLCPGWFPRQPHRPPDRRLSRPEGSGCVAPDRVVTRPRPFWCRASPRPCHGHCRPLPALIGKKGDCMDGSPSRS